MSQTTVAESIIKDVASDVEFPPGDLLSDEPPLETDLHRKQIDLLIRLLEFWWQERQDFYASGNLTIYYSPNQRKSEDFRGPDFFVVLGTERKDRQSWVVWQENGQYPHVIVKILSNKTATVDRGLKKQIYQDIFRTPDYFWFDPFTLEFQGFHLVDLLPEEAMSQQLEQEKQRIKEAEQEIERLKELLQSRSIEIECNLLLPLSTMVTELN